MFFEIYKQTNIYAVVFITASLLSSYVVILENNLFKNVSKRPAFLTNANSNDQIWPK